MVEKARFDRNALFSRSGSIDYRIGLWHWAMSIIRTNCVISQHYYYDRCDCDALHIRTLVINFLSSNAGVDRTWTRLYCSAATLQSEER